MRHKVACIAHSTRLKLTSEGLLVSLTNLYITQGAQKISQVFNLEMA